MVLQHTFLRFRWYCAAHLLIAVLFVGIAGNAGADSGGRICPPGGLSTAEYLSADDAAREEKIAAYRERYRPAMNAAVHRLRTLFAGKPIKIQYRLKTLESIQEKLIRKDYRCLSQMTDIAGVRLIILNYAAIPFVTQSVQEHFTIQEKQNLIDDPRGSGYRAIHYLLSAAGRIVELQVHTVRGNIWALMSHFLVYKGPYRSNEMVKSYFDALSYTLYLLDSGFGHQELPLPTDVPSTAQREIKGGLMLIQAFDVERACPNMDATLEHIEQSGLAYKESDFYGMDEFDLSYRPLRFAEPAPD